MCLRLTSKEVRSVPARRARRRGVRRAGGSAPASAGSTGRRVFAAESGVAPPGTGAPKPPPPESEVDFEGAAAPPPWAEAAEGRTASRVTQATMIREVRTDRSDRRRARSLELWAKNPALCKGSCDAASERTLTGADPRVAR